MTSGRHEAYVGGRGYNKPLSGFLIGEIEYCRSGILAIIGVLNDEFECISLPPYIHLSLPDVIHMIGVPRPSLFFAALPLLFIILNANCRAKNGGGLGTSLCKLLI